MISLILLLAASAAASLPKTEIPARASYFADVASDTVRPLTTPLDLSNPAFFMVETPDGRLQIAYRTIRSLSYSAMVTPVGVTTAVRRLLTVGFSTDAGIHHNLVIQLSPQEAVEPLKTLSTRTGLRINNLAQK